MRYAAALYVVMPHSTMSASTDIVVVAFFSFATQRQMLPKRRYSFVVEDGYVIQSQQWCRTFVRLALPERAKGLGRGYGANTGANVMSTSDASTLRNREHWWKYPWISIGVKFELCGVCLRWNITLVPHQRVHDSDMVWIVLLISWMQRAISVSQHNQRCDGGYAYNWTECSVHIAHTHTYIDRWSWFVHWYQSEFECESIPVLFRIRADENSLCAIGQRYKVTCAYSIMQFTSLLQRGPIKRFGFLLFRECAMYTLSESWQIYTILCRKPIHYVDIIRNRTKTWFQINIVLGTYLQHMQLVLTVLLCILTLPTYTHTHFSFFTHRCAQSATSSFEWERIALSNA